MSNSAPVCHINSPPPGAQPVTPSLPAIPVAIDLQSALQAINTISQIIRAMNNQNHDNNQSGFPQRLTSLHTISEFVEDTSRRTTKVETVKDPNSDASVQVRRITGLTFKNKVTGQGINWKR